MKVVIKNKITNVCDKVVFLALCLLVFFIPFSKAGIENCFGFFVLINTLSLINSGQFLLKSLHALFFKWGEYILLYFIAFEIINSKKRFKIILTVFLVSFALIGVDGIWQYFTGTDFLRSRPLINGWLTASFEHYNIFGSYLCLGIPIAAGLGLAKKAEKPLIKIAVWALVALLLVCITFTYSRGAWVAVLSGLFFIFINQLINLPTLTKKLLLILVGGIFMIGLTFILPNSIKNRGISIVKLQGSGRRALWKDGIAFIKEKPIFGQGLGTYMNKSKGIYAHNCYIQMAAEIGITGLICFLWFLIEFFKLGIHLFKKNNDMLLLGLLAGISSFLINSFFEVNFYSLQVSVLFWFALGMIIGLTKIMENENAIYHI